jgi:hypothetical protein
MQCNFANAPPIVLCGIAWDRVAGLALLMTPVIDAWTTTYENPRIDNDRERLLHFGQADHLRYYGADVRDRISTAGFEVTPFVAVEPCVAKHGLTRGETLYIGKKPAMSD